jgi:hypothetical protein
LLRFRCACLQARWIDSFTTEAANAVWEILGHYVVVAGDRFAIDHILAREAMAFVEIGRREYVAFCYARPGYWETIEGIAYDVMNADVLYAATQGVVVVFAILFRVTAAIVLYFPGTSVSATSVKCIEQWNARQHDAGLSTHAGWCSVICWIGIQTVGQVLSFNAVRVTVIDIGRVVACDRECASRVVWEAIRTYGTNFAINRV